MDGHDAPRSASKRPPGSSLRNTRTMAFNLVHGQRLGARGAENARARGIRHGRGDSEDPACEYDRVIGLGKPYQVIEY